MIRIVEYARASTDEQSLGLEAQGRSTGAYVASKEAQGWVSVARLVDDGVSTRLPIGDRPALTEALRMVRAGEADGIIAAKLDRFSRNTAETIGLMAEANGRHGFTLVALDLGLDTSTPGGKFVMTIMAAMAEWERDVISERTKAALAALAATGVALGRPRLIEGEVEDRIRSMASEGLTTRKIADRLNNERLPTPASRRQVSTARASWGHSTVAAVLSRSATT